MREIPTAFRAMAAYRQWMLYRLVPSRKKPGKMDKLPAHPVTGEVVTAHDPKNWTSARIAVEAATRFGHPYGVAFVLTEQDPFWFLDIDGAAQPDGSWSPWAQTMLQYFAGCAVEVSSSGSGLHIIGSGADLLPDHGVKPIEPIGVDLYSRRRFIALTGLQASGDAGFSPPAQNLQWLALTYFPPKVGNETVGDDLSDTPDPEWRGPVDDDELIRRALRSGIGRSAFGGRASFADLWDANADALARSYPPDPGGLDAYDASKADSALAAHLAFWTGKHGERIRRLMERSCLKREKWERESYMVSTINRACAATLKVLQDQPNDMPAIAADLPPLALPGPLVHPESDLPSEEVESPVAEVRSGSAFVNPEDQVAFFQGCVYVRSIHQVWTPAGELLRPEAFAVAYGGYSFNMDRENSKVSNNAWEAFTQSRVLRHPQVAATCFRPTLPPGAIVADGGRRAVNTYVPVEVRMTEGDPSIFLTHVEKLFPDERDRRIFLSYLAAIVQYKGTKFKWCVVIQGVEGNGKTFFSTAAEYAIGKCYTHWPLAKEIDKNFNAWLFGNMLYCVEDIKVPRSNQDLLETIKPMITNDRLQIEKKGIDQITKDVCGNFIFNTNHKAGIRKTRNDRRLCFHFCPQQEVEDLARDGMGAAYMTTLYDWAKGEGAYAHLGKDYGYSVIAYYLSTYPIDPEFNPAGACQRAPRTSSTAEAVTAGLGAAEQYILEAIDEGRVGFRGGWVSSTYLTRLLDEVRMPYTPPARGNLLRTIGYVPHPGLHRGRTNNEVTPDASKPVLYIHVEDSALASLEGAPAIAAAYSKAQER